MKWILIFGLLIVLLFSGCVGQTLQSKNPLGLTDVLDLCHNTDYSTRTKSVHYLFEIYEYEKWGIEGTDTLIGLDLESYNKLRNKLNEVGDDALLDISDMKCIEVLSFALTITDDDFKISDLSPLSQLPTLKYVVLQNNKVSDLSPLKNLKLIYLNVRTNKISDISSLLEIRTLKYLDLRHNNISNEDCASLKLALSDAEIHC